MAYGDGYAGGYGAAVVEADPTVLVEFEWDTGVWTDEAFRCMAWDTDRGRRFELDDYAAGVATIVLDNSDRRFDPQHAAGPLFGKLKPNRRVRIRSTWAGVTEGLYLGSIDRIDQSYSPPWVATATITATDAFKQLSRAILPDSVYEATVAGSTYAWWRLGDPAGSTFAVERVGQRHAAVVGPVTFGGEPLVSRDGTSSATFGVDAALEVPASVTPLGSAGGIPQWSIEFVLKAGPVAALPDQVVYYQAPSGGGAANVVSVIMLGGALSASGRIVATVWDSAGNRSQATNLQRVDDGFPHHVVVTYSGGANFAVYVDGGGTTSVTFSAAGTTIAAPGVTRIGSYGPGTGSHWTGQLQDVALYGVPLSAGTALERHNARKVGGQWEGDLSGARVTRILGLAGYAGATAVDPGNSALQSTDLGGDALSYLQNVARSEGGRLYVDADGVLQFDQRTATFNPASVATYGDGPGELGYTDLGYSRDAADVRNDIAASRLDGSAQRVSDPASIGEYGRMSHAEEGLMLASDSEVLDRANFLLAQYKDPKDRIGVLAVNPYATPATLFPRVLADDLTTGVTVTRRPQAVGSPITATYTVDAVTHAWTPKQWATHYGLAPLSTTAGSGDFLQLDDTNGPGLDYVRLAY